MKCLVSWSGGKDSALALFRCLNDQQISIVGLVTTINQATQRISMHGVSLDLLKKQTDSIGLPLHVVTLPEICPMDEYEKIMGDFMITMKNNGIEGMVFGDIFLEDIRKYREMQLAKIGLTPIFPLWGMRSVDVASEFLSHRFKSIITCVDGEVLNDEYVGELYSSSFISKLPNGVDPCGENGEFHSFVIDGPIFSSPIHVRVDEKVKIEYPVTKGSGAKTFWFASIVSK